MWRGHWREKEMGLFCKLTKGQRVGLALVLIPGPQLVPMLPAPCQPGAEPPACLPCPPRAVQQLELSLP